MFSPGILFPPRFDVHTDTVDSSDYPSDKNEFCGDFGRNIASRFAFIRVCTGQKSKTKDISSTFKAIYYIYHIFTELATDLLHRYNGSGRQGHALHFLPQMKFPAVILGHWVTKSCKVNKTVAKNSIPKWQRIASLLLLMFRLQQISFLICEIFFYRNFIVFLPFFNAFRRAFNSDSI